MERVVMASGYGVLMAEQAVAWSFGNVARTAVNASIDRAGPQAATTASTCSTLRGLRACPKSGLT